MQKETVPGKKGSVELRRSHGISQYYLAAIVARQYKCQELILDGGRGEGTVAASPTAMAGAYLSCRGDQRKPAAMVGLLEFALEHVLLAAVVEAEDLVVDIEAVHDETKAMVEAHATLHIELKCG